MSVPSVRKNYVYRLLYEVLVVITPLITTPYIARVLEPDGVGIYSYVSSIMTYFTLIAALGTASYGSREIAQHRDDKQVASKLFWEIELMTVLTTSICLIAWIVLIFLSTEYRILFIAITPTLFATMFDISWFYTGHEKIIYSVSWNAICKILGIILMFSFVKEKSDLGLYVIINSSVLLFGNVSMWVFLPKLLTRVNFRTLSLKRHFRETLIYFIPAVATTIYTVLDKTLIKVITGDVFQNGYYEEATKVINLVKSIVFTSINSVMGARISYLFVKKADKEIKIRIHRSMDFILLLGYGCMFGIIGISRNFVPFFFGKNYTPVIVLLNIMSVLVIIIGISNCLGTQYFTPSGRRKESAKYIIIGCITNLILNICMIPALGATGAVIASIIAELTITVLYLRNSRDYFDAKGLIVLSWKRITAGLLMCCIVWLVGFLPIDYMFAKLLLQITGGIIVYAIVLTLLKDNLFVELKTQSVQLFRQYV